MKLPLTVFGVIFLSVLIGMAVSCSGATTQAAKPGALRTPVVVELFTSEGCSSCPPADALLARLYKDQPVQGANVIALEEHVDYWDDLGWKDPFSSHEWTRRQEEYASIFRSGSIYTPQMIVDGQAELVGSRERQSQKEIAEGARRAKTDISLTADKPARDGNQKFFIRVGSVNGVSSDDIVEVWLAVAENNLQSSVTRGENAGEHLRHTAVLRTLRKIGVAEPGKDTSFEGAGNVRLDASWKRENTLVILFLQEKKSRRILGAAETPAA